MKKEINVIMGERIKVARWKKEMTREQLAEKVSVSVRFLADVESGEVGVSVATLKKIANALDVSMDYLTGLVDNDSGDFRRQLIINKINNIDEKYLGSIDTVISEIESIISAK